MEKKYISIGEASKRLCVGIDTVRRWVDSGKLSAYITPTKHRKILVEDIMRLQNDKSSIQKEENG